MNANIMKAKNSSKKLNLKPAPGYLIILPLEAQDKTSSGIYLPDSANEKPQKGKVLAVGKAEVTENGLRKDPPADTGDLVIYKKWGGNEVKIDGVEYLFAKFDDILAVVIS